MSEKSCLHFLKKLNSLESLQEKWLADEIPTQCKSKMVSFGWTTTLYATQQDNKPNYHQTNKLQLEGSPSLDYCLNMIGFNYLSTRERNSRWDSGLVSNKCKEVLLAFSKITIKNNIRDRQLERNLRV